MPLERPRIDFETTSLIAKTSFMFYYKMQKVELFNKQSHGKF